MCLYHFDEGRGRVFGTRDDDHEAGALVDSQHKVASGGRDVLDVKYVGHGDFIRLADSLPNMTRRG